MFASIGGLKSLSEKQDADFCDQEELHKDNVFMSETNANDWLGGS